MTDDRTAGGGSPDEQILTWRVRRCTHSVSLCLLVLIFQFVLALAVYIREGPVYAAIVLFFLFVALLPFYGAYRYVLSPEGLKVFGPLYYAEHEWDEFDGWRLYEADVRLHFKDKPRTAVLVLFAPGRVTQVLTYVQRYLPGISLEDRRL